MNGYWAVRDTGTVLVRQLLHAEVQLAGHECYQRLQPRYLSLLGSGSMLLALACVCPVYPHG